MPPALPFWSRYEGRRVAITGGASFIGSHLTERLLHAGAHVTVGDDFSSGSRLNLAGVESDLEIQTGDLRDPDMARRTVNGAEVVFHLAAQHGGRGYIETHPVECLGNMVLDHVVFAESAASGVERIVHASSACVYPTTLQTTERAPVLLRESDAGFDAPGKANADGEYGWAKLMGEMQLHAFHKQYGIDGVAARIFTAYGERENETHAVVALIAKAMRRLDPYPIWGDGKQTRNFTYIDDIVTGLAVAGGLTGFQALNIGGSSQWSIRELADTIFATIGWRPSHFVFEPGKPVGVRSRAADNTKMRELTGWEPSTALPDGVAQTIEWYSGVSDDKGRGDIDTLLMER